MILYKAQAQDSQQLRRQLPLDFLTLTQTELKSSFKMDNLIYVEVQHEAFEGRTLTAALEASSLRLCPCFLTLVLCSSKPQLYNASVYAASARLVVRRWKSKVNLHFLSIDENVVLVDRRRNFNWWECDQRKILKLTCNTATDPRLVIANGLPHVAPGQWSGSILLASF